jgi:Uncharacterized ACR, COG1399.
MSSRGWLVKNAALLTSAPLSPVKDEECQTSKEGCGHDRANDDSSNHTATQSSFAALRDCGRSCCNCGKSDGRNARENDILATSLCIGLIAASIG